MRFAIALLIMLSVRAAGGRPLPTCDPLRGYFNDVRQVLTK